MAERKNSRALQNRRSRLDRIRQAMDEPTEPQPQRQQDAFNGHGVLEGSGSERSFDGRSEMHPSDMSSNLFNPRWRRLLRAVAQVLASKVQCTDVGAGPGSNPGAGGGTEKDITFNLKASLEDIELNDEEKGFVLVSAYHFLDASDLAISVATWRSLIAVALIAAVRTVTQGSPRGLQAESRIRDGVAHWWPPPGCDDAYEAFTRRTGFEGQITPAVRASRYFELRDRALSMSYSAESMASAVASFHADRGPPPGGRRHVGGGRLDTSSRSGGSGRSSGSNIFEYTDGDSSSSWGSRGNPTREPVISI